MSEQLTRRKPSIFWWIGAAFALLIGWFLWSLFGPNPPIIVSKQTTYITAPLAADGLPDYEAYLLEEMRKHKPKREDNAAVAWLQLRGPRTDRRENWRHFQAELGPLIPPQGLRYLLPLEEQGLTDEFCAWAEKQYVKQHQTEPLWWGVCESIIETATSRAWDDANLPPLAKWINEQELGVHGAFARG